MQKIFVAWGASDLGGHAPARLERPLTNGDDVFCFKSGIFEQNPSEPVFGRDGSASTPLRYFADRLAGHSGDDIAFMAGSQDHHDWHQGIGMLTHHAISETKHMLDDALDAGWELGGVILLIGPGDADTWREVQTYEHRFIKAVHRIRDVFGADTEIFNCQATLCDGNKLRPDDARRVQALRHEQAEVTHHVRDCHVVRTSTHWDSLPGNSEAFHLDVHGQVLFGHAIAEVVWNTWI
jgi:hypothetical protein